MCMLTYFPEGTEPDVEKLLNGTLHNNDGHGYAIVDPVTKSLIIRKSMDPEFLIADFAKMRAAYPLGPAMFHSRWGTGGDVTEFNCHPFYVTDYQGYQPLGYKAKLGYNEANIAPVNDLTVVGHNGVLQVAQDRKDPRSDTRAAAEEIMGAWYDLADEFERDQLAEWIGPGNKLVFLTVDPRFDRHAYIINEKRGVWDEGVWYSNHDFIGYSKWDDATRFLGAGGVDKDGGYNAWADDRCAFCGSLSEGIDENGFCKLCGSCVDCLSERNACECYVPTVEDQSRARAEYVDWWVDQEDSSTGETLAEAEAAARIIRIEEALVGLGVQPVDVKRLVQLALTSGTTKPEPDHLSEEDIGIIESVIDEAQTYAYEASTAQKYAGHLPY